ncbi:MAG: hypothetical protein PVJ67_02195 [Candidatus Pacearchaeota archaeon]|jgi:hypothetical protein
MISIGRHKVEGNYWSSKSKDQKRGSHSGEIIVCKGKRIIGSLTDSEKPKEDLEKIILGKILPKISRIVLAKIPASPENSYFNQVIYSLSLTPPEEGTDYCLKGPWRFVNLIDVFSQKRLLNSKIDLLNYLTEIKYKANRPWNGLFQFLRHQKRNEKYFNEQLKKKQIGTFHLTRID